MGDANAPLNLMHYDQNIKKQMSLTYEQKLKLRQEILSLSPDDWKSICSIILIPNNENLTVNENGVYFCLNNISNKSIQSIINYIQHRNNVTEKSLRKNLESAGT